MRTIVLVHPPFRFRPPVWPESRPPLVIAHLYAVLERARLGRVEAIDLDLEFDHSEENVDYFLSEAVERIEATSPSVLCLTCKSAQLPFSALLVRKYRLVHPETKIIVGGWIPTLVPEHVLRLSGCDAVIRGEGERSLPELLKRIEDKNWAVEGISYRPSGQDMVIHNLNSRPLTQKELDGLPLPRYEALPPLERYFRGDKPCFTVEASRGCTHGKCIFCWNSTKNCDTTWRAKSPKKVVKEIKWLHDTYGCGIFFFSDDSFGAKSEWLTEFVSRMSDEFHLGEVGYVASMRIDAVDEKMLPSLYRSGLRTVFHGIESGSPECWKTLRKGFDPKVNSQYILELARKEMRAGIRPMFSFIAGIPSETSDDLDETVSLSRRLADLGALISTQILAPHQGTALFELYSDLIEPYDVYGELGRSESFLKEYHLVFGDRLKDFMDYLPDFRRVRPSMPLDRFMEGYSLLPGSTVRTKEPK